MDGHLVRVVVNGVQVSMLTSHSYLKDSKTYTDLSIGVLGRWHPVGGGGEGDFDCVGECVPSLQRSVYGDREGKENGSFDDFRTDRLGYGGGDLDEAESWDGTGLYALGKELVGRWFRQHDDMALGCYISCLRCS